MSLQKDILWYAPTAADVLTAKYIISAQRHISLQQDRILTTNSRSPYKRIYYSHLAADILSAGYTIHTQQYKPL